MFDAKFNLQVNGGVLLGSVVEANGVVGMRCFGLVAVPV